MAINVCRSCEKKYAESLLSCPQCSSLSDKTLRDIKLLNQEIGYLEHLLKTMRDQKLPCRECNAVLPFHKTMSCARDQRFLETGVYNGYIDDTGNVSVTEKIIEHNSISCKYKTVSCPSCSSRTPFGGTYPIFSIPINFDDGFLRFFKDLFVLGLHGVVAIFLGFMFALAVDKDTDSLSLVIVPAFVFLIIIRIADRFFAKKNAKFINHNDSIVRFFLKNEKDIKYALARVSMATQFLPRRKDYSIKLKSEISKILDESKENFNLEITEDSLYLKPSIF